MEFDGFAPFDAVKAYTDAMLAYGRDDCAENESSLFAAELT